jgi:hypothetical protein
MGQNAEDERDKEANEKNRSKKWIEDECGCHFRTDLLLWAWVETHRNKWGQVNGFVFG